MTRPRTRMFAVESLEGKRLLSAMHATHHGPTSPAPFVLDGNLKDPSSKVIYSDDSAQITEEFSGQVKGMGRVSGTLDNFSNNTPALSPNGGILFDQPPDSSFVLANSRGSVNLTFARHDSYRSLDGLPLTEVGFFVRSGTGAYAAASGVGIFTETGGMGRPTDLKLHTSRPH